MAPTVDVAVILAKIFVFRNESLFNREWYKDSMSNVEIEKILSTEKCVLILNLITFQIRWDNKGAFREAEYFTIF